MVSWDRELLYQRLEMSIRSLLEQIRRSEVCIHTSSKHRRRLGQLYFVITEHNYPRKSLKRRSRFCDAPLIEVCFFAVVQIAAEATIWLDTDLNMQ